MGYFCKILLTALFCFILGFESANKYKIYNSLGQEVYYAKEDTDCCTRQLCGPGRPFLMNITDTRGQDRAGDEPS